MEYDPEIAARFAELREKAALAAANPEVGEAEVTAVASAYDQLLIDSGLAEDMEHRRRLRRYHHRGRAIDMPPRSNTADWIRRLY